MERLCLSSLAAGLINRFHDDFHQGVYG